MKWIWCLFIFSSVACGASYGPQFPTSGTNDSSVGTTAWSNPSFITAQDVNYSSNTVLAGLDSNYIVGSGFDFSACPSATQISGILLQTDKTQPFPDLSGIRSDSSIILVIGTSTSTNKAAGAGVNWKDTNSYGGSTDLWGLTNITCGSLSTLQVKMSAHDGDDISSGVVGLGHMKITVYGAATSKPIADYEDLF